MDFWPADTSWRPLRFCFAQSCASFAFTSCRKVVLVPCHSDRTAQTCKFASWVARDVQQRSGRRFLSTAWGLYVRVVMHVAGDAKLLSWSVARWRGNDDVYRSVGRQRKRRPRRRRAASALLAIPPLVRQPGARAGSFRAFQSVERRFALWDVLERYISGLVEVKLVSRCSLRSQVWPQPRGLSA